MSADGAIVVGTSGSEERGNQGFRWTEAEGLQGLGGLIDGGSSYASAISSDGSTIVGAVTTATRGEAAYWTEDTGWMAIGTLEGAAIDVNPAASNVSSDGTTIAGNSSSTAARLAEAFVWTAETGMQGLGFLTENHTISTITGISGDGQTLIGVSGTLTGDQVSFIWDAEHGMRSIKEFFVEVHGLDLSEWTLGNALDISTDGHTLVGSGVHNGVSEGWVAHIPAN